MKALDKIFIDLDLIAYYSLTDKHDGDLEYIRKDALLEWAKEYKRAIETHGDEKHAYTRGEYSVLNLLIDKIESL